MSKCKKRTKRKISLALFIHKRILFTSLNTHALDDGDDDGRGHAPAPGDKATLDAADNAQQHEEANRGGGHQSHVASLGGGQKDKQGIDHAQQPLDERGERTPTANGDDGHCAFI